MYGMHTTRVWYRVLLHLHQQGWGPLKPPVSAAPPALHVPQTPITAVNQSKSSQWDAQPVQGEGDIAKFLCEVLSASSRSEL